MTVLIRLAADALALLHLGFVLFVAFGGLVVLRWPRLVWLHLPAAAWGAWVEFAGWICPLTPLENALRRIAGTAGYSGGFIDHYLWPLIYPAGLTHDVQLALGLGVVVINVAVYGVLLARRARNRNGPTNDS